MAPPTYISLGQLITMTQNTVYALPPGGVVSVLSSAAVEVGLTTGTTGWNTLTNASTIGAQTPAPFIRGTTADTVVFVRRYN